MMKNPDTLFFMGHVSSPRTVCRPLGACIRLAARKVPICSRYGVRQSLVRHGQEKFPEMGPFAANRENAHNAKAQGQIRKAEKKWRQIKSRGEKGDNLSPSLRWFGQIVTNCHRRRTRVTIGQEAARLDTVWLQTIKSDSLPGNLPANAARRRWTRRGLAPVQAQGMAMISPVAARMTS